MKRPRRSLKETVLMTWLVLILLLEKFLHQILDAVFRHEQKVLTKIAYMDPELQDYIENGNN